MKITLQGAAGGEVTGSSYLVETQGASLLVDCGIFQGSPHAGELNHLAGFTAPRDAILITHAHLDHTGRLPLLVRAGFRGPIFTTQATREMTGLILRDSAKIQTQDADRHNRQRQRAGEEPLQPLYTLADVDNTLSLIRSVPFHEPVTVAPGVKARFVEAGHMLGSASIELTVQENGGTKIVIFSGDLGPKGAPILRDAEPFARADLVFMESTYGDRDHKPFADTVHEFVGIVQQAVAHQGKIIVPTFAIGRAQVLTALLAWMFRQKQVPPFPVFLDSPMAIEASQIYQHHPELYDEEALAFLREKPIARDLATLRMTVSTDESRQINACTGPCLIMAGAGMCNAGRILHHLRHNLWDPSAHVLIVGFQGQGTLGRQLVEGAKKVFIYGEPVAVKARVHTLGGFSAHAGQSDLMAWLETLLPSKPRVVLTHGDTGPRNALAKVIAERHGLTPLLPALGETVTL